MLDELVNVSRGLIQTLACTHAPTCANCQLTANAEQREHDHDRNGLGNTCYPYNSIRARLVECASDICSAADNHDQANEVGGSRRSWRDMSHLLSPFECDCATPVMR